jgi:hypothetical protein
LTILDPEPPYVNDGFRATQWGIHMRWDIKAGESVP